MKTTTKLGLGAAAFAIVATTVAFADDPQLQNRLALQRSEAQFSPQATTIGVYRPERRWQKEATIAFTGHRKSVRRTEKAQRGEDRWMEVTTPHGTVDYFAPGQ